MVIKIVTDSTSDINTETAGDMGVAGVPVSFQTQAGLDMAAMAAAELAMQAASHQEGATTAASMARRAQSSVHSPNVNSYHIITHASGNPYGKFIVQGYVSPEWNLSIRD